MEASARSALSVAALTGACLLLPCSALANPACRGEAWVGAWAASPSDATGPRYADESLRLIVNPSMGGGRVRVRLSNRLGAGPVTFSAARIARRASGAGVVAGSSRALLFAGRPTVTLAPRREIRSDAARLHFKAFEDLAVSVHVKAADGPATRHHDAQQVSYVAVPGEDHTADTAAGAFTREIDSWPYLTGVDVRTHRRAGAVVTVGDSITDGELSGVNVNRRYPDLLARRLAQARRPLSVLNAGIGGNRIVSDGTTPVFGPSVLNRLSLDVIDQAGARDVIVLAGTNDIGIPPPASASMIIAGLRATIERLHKAGLRAIVGTQTPTAARALNYGTLGGIATRNVVNAWIRFSGAPDGVIDFHAATKDPSDPDRLRPAYDGGDHLHPSNAGYRAMAEAVPLAVLRGAPCASPITLRVDPRSARARRRTRFRFRATVRRDGRSRALSAVAIRLAGRTVRTNRRGQATVVSRPSRPGRLRIRASRAGHASDVVVVRVRRR